MDKFLKKEKCINFKQTIHISHFKNKIAKYNLFTINLTIAVLNLMPFEGHSLAPLELRVTRGFTSFTEFLIFILKNNLHYIINIQISHLLTY